MSVTHFDGYTVEDWLALPDDDRRWELHDGALHVTPPPFSRHALIVARVRKLVEAVLPDTALAVDSLGVHASRTRVLIPDLAVVERELLERNVPYVQGTDLQLAVEVESPSSVRWIG
jgi:Uma2 family endonuclease